MQHPTFSLEQMHAREKPRRITRLSREKTGKAGENRGEISYANEYTPYRKVDECLMFNADRESVYVRWTKGSELHRLRQVSISVSRDFLERHVMWRYYAVCYGCMEKRRLISCKCPIRYRMCGKYAHQRIGEMSSYLPGITYAKDETYLRHSVEYWESLLSKQEEILTKVIVDKILRSWGLDEYLRNAIYGELGWRQPHTSTGWD
jgi:hypothetical protein